MLRLSRYFVFICVFLFLLSDSLNGQVSVQGRVTDDTDEPLIGVNIVVKDLGTGTVTDFDGKYELEVPSRASILVFSYIGFETQELVASNEQLDLVMGMDGKQLNEVVVTAFGIERQKRSLGYATENVGGEELAKSNAPDVINALAGKMAGVNIVQSNGVEGGTSRVVIRGNNNITGNNQPLIIVDGVPFENDPGFGETQDNKDITGGTDWGSAINNINPADIESMDVLKGANAAALYGARGMNGVILITLKKGAKRKGFGVDYSTTYRSIEATRFRDTQNVFGAGGPISTSEPRFEEDADGQLIYPSSIVSDNGPGGVNTNQSFGFYGGSQSWGPRMDGTMIRWWDGELRAFNPQPDNQKLFYDKGSTLIHNIAFSGGGEDGTIRVSFTRADHDAITPKSEYQQNTVSLGGNLNVTDRLKTEMTINYIDYERLNAPALSNDANNSFESGMLYSFPRSYKGLNFDFENGDGTRRSFEGWPFLYVSPYLVWNAHRHNTRLDRDKWLGSIGLNYALNDWISLSGRIGVDNTNDIMETRRTPIDVTGTVIDDGSGGFYNIPVAYEKSYSKEKVINNEVMLSLKREALFGSAFNATLRLGGNQWRRDRDYLMAVGAPSLRDPFLYNFDNYQYELPLTENDLPELQEQFYAKRINSLFAFVDLSWQNMLFVQLTGRNDWSSTLPLDNNSYFYPSANLSFVLTEAWRSGIPAIFSHIKFRTALSQTATDDDPYQLNAVFETGTFNGNSTSTQPSTIPPVALKPQRAVSWEAGIETGIWDDRIRLDLTYYSINSYDQLLRSPVPSSSGFNTVKINTGELSNRGIEAILSARLVQARDFSWTTGLTYARNTSRLEKLEEGADILELAGIWGDNGPSISVKAGQPYGIIVGYDYVRHPDSGLPIVSDDGRFFEVTETQVPIEIYDDNGNFQRFANATPKFTGAWTNTLKFKNFALNTLIDVKYGGDMWFGSYALGLQSGQSPETLLEREGGGLPYTDDSGEQRNVGVVLEGVHEDGSPNTQVVHYYYKYLNSGGWGRALTAPAVMENTWVKLREISLSYRVPAGLISSARIFQNLSLAVTGRDLLYLYQSAPDNINPEGGIGAGNAQGLEFASMPGTRSIGFTLKASF